MEPEEKNNIEIYRLKFILKRHVFVLPVTSVNTGSVQVTHRAVGARTMHGFGTDLTAPNIIGIRSSDVLVGRFSPQKWETLNFIFFNLPVLIVFLNGKSRHAVG